MFAHCNIIKSGIIWPIQTEKKAFDRYNSKYLGLSDYLNNTVGSFNHILSTNFKSFTDGGHGHYSDFICLKTWM